MSKERFFWADGQVEIADGDGFQDSEDGIEEIFESENDDQEAPNEESDRWRKQTDQPQHSREVLDAHAQVAARQGFGGKLGFMLSGAHAPTGGATIAGKEFRGGQFIPGKVLAQASPEEKKQLEANGGVQVRERHTFERGEDIAHWHHQNMISLLAKTQKGEYDPDDATDDADIYFRDAAQHNTKNYAQRYKRLKAKVGQIWGAQSLESPEWGAVKKAFQESRDKTESLMEDSKDTVLYLLAHAKKDAQAGQPVKFRRADKSDLGEAHDNLVQEHDRSIHRIADAMDAFKAKHPRQDNLGTEVGTLTWLGTESEEDRESRIENGGSQNTLLAASILDPADRGFSYDSPPALKCAQCEGLKVKLVDGFRIRNSSLKNVEFTNAGTHHGFPDLIQPDEIWLDQTLPEEERWILVADMRAALHAEHGKLDEDIAYDRGATVEKTTRQTTRLVQRGDIYRQKWGTIQGMTGPITVWIVNGTNVRNFLQDDFVEGTNGVEEPYCPAMEIWIEECVVPEERPYIVLHEYVERMLMKRFGLAYDEAHRHASAAEFRKRKQGGWTREDCLKLTPDDAGIPPEKELTTLATEFLGSGELADLARVFLATHHAPPGKPTTIQGKEFAPGEFIPGKVMEQATAEEKAKLVEKNGENKANSAGKIADSSGEKSQKAAERKKVLEGLSGEIKARFDLGSGANESEVNVYQDGSKAIFKPRDGEERELRHGVQGGTYFRREAAAYQVAEILGLGDLVPPTIIRLVGMVGLPGVADHEGSSQAFVKDATVAMDVDAPFDGPEDLARAAAFDYLIGASDRHSGNWMLDKDGKLVLIDNGLSFPTVYAREDYFDIKFLQQAVQDNLPLPDLVEWKGKWPEVEKSLKSVGLEREAIALTKKRFDALVSTSPGSGFDGLSGFDMPTVAAMMPRAKKQGGAIRRSQR